MERSTITTRLLRRWINMSLRVLFTFITFCFTLAPAWAKEPVVVEVEEPFIELHTGPGRGYPIFYVVEQGGTIIVTRRRTDWFEVVTQRQKRGWVHRDQLELTLDLSGKAIRIDDTQFGSYSNRRWEFGVLDGDFGGADVISVFGAYSVTPNLSAELMIAQGVGTFSDSVFATANIVHQFFPDKRITPYMTLGGGMIRTSPNATLVQTEDRTDQIAHAGLGLRAYATRRLLFRTEYKSYVIFTSRDDNQEVEEWKLGFSFFF